MNSSTKAIFVATQMSSKSVFIFKTLKHALDIRLSSVGDVVIKQLSLSHETLSGSSIQPLTPESRDLIPEIEFLFADPNFIVDLASHPSNRLKWAQSTFAGVDVVVDHRDQLKLRPDFVLTKTWSGFPEFMSEYVLGQIIARERKFPQMYELQKQASFDTSAVIEYKSLNELSVGILGLGNIGSEVARVCKALNMTVWGVVRDEKLKANKEHCPYLDHIRGMSKLNEMLAQCDYVVNVLPSTVETRGLLNGRVLQACQDKKTVFVNIGRGDIIDDEMLINALSQGWLGGAILDVVNNEPLPSSSPLWTMPGVTITPHNSGASSVVKCVNDFVENFTRYKNGEPLLNIVNIDKGY